MKETPTPIAIKEGKIKLGNIILRCSVLDSGERVINKDDIAKVFHPDAKFSAREAEEAMRKLKEL